MLFVGKYPSRYVSEFDAEFTVVFSYFYDTMVAGLGIQLQFILLQVAPQGIHPSSHLRLQLKKTQDNICLLSTAWKSLNI